MSMNATIQLRIDAATKSKAQKVLKELGLDLSSAVKLFLTQVVRSRSLPISNLTVNGFTPAQERRIIKETEWAEKHGKKYTDVKKMIDDMLA